MCGGGGGGDAPTIPERQAAKSPDGGVVKARDEDAHRRRLLMARTMSPGTQNLPQARVSAEYLGG